MRDRNIKIERKQDNEKVVNVGLDDTTNMD